MGKGTSTKDDKPWDGRYCRDCAHCEPYLRFETLSVHGRQPTMGICPYNEYKVLLSEAACKEHFKPKRVNNENTPRQQSLFD